MTHSLKLLVGSIILGLGMVGTSSASSSFNVTLTLYNDTDYPVQFYKCSSSSNNAVNTNIGSPIAAGATVTLSSFSCSTGSYYCASSSQGITPIQYGSLFEGSANWKWKIYYGGATANAKKVLNMEQYS